MERKRICFISQCSLPIPTTKGGAVETLVEYLIDANEEKNDFEFGVISIEEKNALEISKKYKNTNFYYVKNKKRRFLFMYIFLYKVLKRFGFYIPFTPEFKDALCLVRELLDEYDLFIYEAGPTTQLPVLNKIIPKEKLVAHLHWDGLSNSKKDRSFKYLITVSKYIANQWEKTGSDKDGNIFILSNCANTEHFEKTLSLEEINEFKKLWKIPNNHKVLIFTGRIVEEKGVLELITAFKKLRYENITLLIVGSANFGKKSYTSYEKKVFEEINNSKHNIVLTGFIPHNELYKFYSISDIAIMPSLFQDPAPLVSIETQVTGTPLIATKVGGIPEYTSEDTILVEVNSKLIDNLSFSIDNLLSNEEKRNKMSVNGIKHAKKFNLEKYYKDFYNIIEQIMK